MAKNLMLVCEQEGVSLNTLYLGKTPATKQASVTFFESKDGAAIHRLLTGERSCESFLVVMQACASNSEDAETLGRQVFAILDNHSDFTSKDGRYSYMSVLAIGPLVQVDLDANERFTFEAIFTVLRKELQNGQSL